MQNLETATLGWVDWFTNRRLLGLIGNIPSAAAEQNFYAQRDVLDMSREMKLKVSGEAGAIHL